MSGFTCTLILDYFPAFSNRRAMSLSRYGTLMLLTLFLLGPTEVLSIRRCGPDICRDEQICCAQGNNSAAVTCCKQPMDKTFYNIAMVTRKLSGVLIMLLLFAVGYFVHRALCSKSRQLSQPLHGHPSVTTSQEPLVESSEPDEAPPTQLPSYEEAKRLPTYEETMRAPAGAVSSQCETSVG